MPTELSIVILNYFSTDFCLACLESLSIAGWPGDRAQTLVIDNGSRDGDLERIARQFPMVRIIRNTRNTGIAGGRKQGSLLASGPFVLFLDVDTTVTTGAIEAMFDAIADPGVGIVGPKLLSFDQRLQYTCRLYPTLRGKIARRIPSLFQSWADREELRTWDHNSRKEVDYVIGACQLARRSVIETIGTHDERFFYGPDDVDFCLRAQLAGWRVVYEPKALVRHAERRVTHRRGSARLKAIHAVGLLYYFAKHRYLLSRRRLYGRIDRARQQMEFANRAVEADELIAR